MLLWLGFIIYALAIIYSGTNLSRYGDIIAEKTGLGGTWIGIVLIGFVTSLPDIFLFHTYCNSQDARPQINSRHNLSFPAEYPFQKNSTVPRHIFS